MSALVEALSVISGFLAALLGAICYLQGKLIKIRECRLREMAANCSAVLRDSSAETASVVRVFEDVIRLDPAIAEPVQVDLMNLEHWRKSTIKAADLIDEYIRLTDPDRRPTLRQAWKDYQRISAAKKKAAAAAAETPQEKEEP